MKLVEITPSTIATAIEISESLLWRIAGSTSELYKPSRKILIKGKRRPIDPPKLSSKRFLRRLHRFIQSNIRFPRNVHGGCKGRSCVTAAVAHKGKPFVASRDVDNCYPSITTEMLRLELLGLGCRSDTSMLLSLLFTHRGVVPHGSPASPDALNLFFMRIDRRLHRLASRKNVSFTRTYDDLVVSSRSFDAADRFTSRIDEEVVQVGLSINQKKKAQKGLQKCNKLQEVHSLVVNSPLGVGANDDQKRRAIDIGESYVRSARSVSPESFEALAYKRSQLHGWIYYFRQLRFSPAAHLRRLMEQGDRLVRRKLESEQVARTSKWWVRAKRRNRAREIANRWCSIRSTKQVSA